MIKKKFFPKKYFEKTTYQKNIVRRITGVNYIKPRPKEHFERYHKLPKQRGGIFKKITKRTRSF